MLSPVDLQREAEATGFRAEALEKVLRLLELLDHLNDRGEIVPELVTADPEMQRLLRGHPGLRWKALNVRQHRGLDSGTDETDES